jgi:DNA-binding response OmpR family regulator
MRILLVEDDRRIVAFLEQGLKAHAYAVESVRTAAEALVRAPDADLVVLDLRLPDGDGMNVLRQLRAEGVRVPVIVLTARDGVDDRVLSLDSGADDYLA